MQFEVAGIAVFAAQQWEPDRLRSVLTVRRFLSRFLIPTPAGCIFQRCFSRVGLPLLTCRRWGLCLLGCEQTPAAPVFSVLTEMPGATARPPWTLTLGTGHHAARKANHSAAVWRCLSSYSPIVCQPPAVRSLQPSSSRSCQGQRDPPGRTQDKRSTTGPVNAVNQGPPGHLPGGRWWKPPPGRWPGTQKVLSKGPWVPLTTSPTGGPCGTPWVQVLTGRWAGEAPGRRGGAGWGEGALFRGSVGLARASLLASSIEGAGQTALFCWAAVGTQHTCMPTLRPSCQPRPFLADGGPRPAGSTSVYWPHSGSTSGKRDLLSLSLSLSFLLSSF